MKVYKKIISKAAQALLLQVSGNKYVFLIVRMHWRNRTGFLKVPFHYQQTRPIGENAAGKAVALIARLVAGMKNMCKHGSSPFDSKRVKPAAAKSGGRFQTVDKPSAASLDAHGESARGDGIPLSQFNLRENRNIFECFCFRV